MTEHRYINPWLIAVSVMFATFMEVLDTTVVNVSLPHIAGSLSASIDEATWALTSYLVANAIILPMTGWLASRFGRKSLLMLSVIGFTAASFLCGLAPTLGMLILFRVLQGATGGALAATVPGRAPRSVPAARPRKSDGLLGTWDRRGADSWPGARRLADRRLQLALGLLHQHPGGHRLAGDDTALHLRPAVSAQRKPQHRLLGHRDARGRDRRVADRARQRTAGRLVFVLVDHDARGSQRRLHRRAHHSRADDGESGHRSAGLQGAKLCGRRLPDDHPRLRVVRKHGAAPHHAADAARAIRRSKRALRWRHAVSARFS